MHFAAGIIHDADGRRHCRRSQMRITLVFTSPPVLS
jgi:hypothetical protein